MNKNFWDNMVKMWCKTISSVEISKLKNKACEHAKNDVKSKSGYSVNPLDDFDDEEDDWDV